MNALLARSDANTANLIANIKSQYEDLINTQTKNNAAGLAGETNFLLQAGALQHTGSGQNVLDAKVTEGVQNLKDLTDKENMAISQAQIAGENEDFQIQSKLNDEIESIRKEKQTAIIKVADDLNTAKKDAQTQANWAATNALDEKTFDEKVKTDAFDQQYKLEDLALKKQANRIASSIPNLPVVQTTSTGVPVKATQDQFLDSIPGGPNGAMATGIKGLASYTIDPNTFSSRVPAGQTQSQRQQLVTMAQQYDPTFDEKQYAARSSYLKSLQSGNLSNTINSANKAVQHLTSFANSVSALDNSGVSAKLNAIGNAIEKPFSSKLQTNISQAKTEASGVKDELAKFFKGTGSTDVKSIDDWAKNLNTNATPGELKGTVQGAITLMAGQLDTLNQQYLNTMGKPPINPLLQPDTVAKLSDLKNKGYDVPIPGVLYTDKDAYIKNGGTPDALIKAHQELLDNGLDGSPENALQWAQLSNQ